MDIGLTCLFEFCNYLKSPTSSFIAFLRIRVGKYSIWTSCILVIQTRAQRDNWHHSWPTSRPFSNHVWVLRLSEDRVQSFVFQKCHRSFVSPRRPLAFQSRSTFRGTITKRCLKYCQSSGGRRANEPIPNKATSDSWKIVGQGLPIF